MIVLKKRRTIEDPVETEFPRYYIGPDITISVNDYGQYVVHDIGYLEVEGIIELGEGAMIIIEQGA